MSHGYVFVLLCYIGRDDSYNSQGVVYTYRREASRCSFRQIGQCEGLKDVKRATRVGFTLFLLFIKCLLEP